jgi:adenylate cyclase
MPGPEIHLNAINALLQGAFITEQSPRNQMLLVIGGTVLSLLVWRTVRRPFVRLLTMAAVSGAWIGVVALFYNHASLLLPSVAPLVALLFTGVSGLVADTVSERMEKARLRRTLERYVSHDVVREMLATPEKLAESLGGVVKPVTVLFSDIRSFTRFSAKTDARRLVLQLNEYFTAMVECVFAHGGTLDKFIGDALMAVWGNAPGHDPATAAQEAVRCALAMRVALEKLNEKWRRESRQELDIGIALQYGDAIVGNIGSPQRMEWSVIGDTVNIAWRLQERTKDFPGQIIVGSALASLLEPEITTTPLGEITVGGTLSVRYGAVVVEKPAALAAKG